MFKNLYFLKNLPKKTVLNNFLSNKSYSSKAVILGIETSCDDTGCAIVDSDGNILGEALNSQHLIHLNNGGIIPPIAQDLHRWNIERVVDDTLNHAKLSFDHIDAIATTVKPGLPLSLQIGTKYGKHLCRKYNKPFIPIHHMEAHALTARMINKIDFPFLVLLISGGHCLLAVAQDVDKFLLLGDSMDDAPGEALDKVARRMKLKNIPEFSQLSGGQAVELAASKADNPLQYKFTTPLVQYKNCHFSFSGIKTQLQIHVIKEETAHNITADEIIPGVYNLCAGFLLVMTRHLCHRVQRGMEYVELKGLLPSDKRTLVLSGGAACNNFITKGLKIICDQLGYTLIRPPKKLCTDNGVMIAWNGIERWRTNNGVMKEFDSVNIEQSCPLGESLMDDVANENINCNWVKLNVLNQASAFK